MNNTKILDFLNEFESVEFKNKTHDIVRITVTKTIRGRMAVCEYIVTKQFIKQAIDWHKQVIIELNKSFNKLEE